MDWGKMLGNSFNSGLIPAFGNMFSDNPSDSADEFLKQIPDELRQYLMPYINTGNQALPGLQEQYGQMMNNPGQLFSKLASGYQTSPGYEFRKNQGLNAIQNAEAAGGMTGSPEHQQQAGELAGNLASQDFNGYMKNILGLYQGGIGGEQGFYNTGYNASTNLAQALAQALQGRAYNAYEGANTENSRMGSLESAFGQFLPSLPFFA